MATQKVMWQQVEHSHRVAHSGRAVMAWCCKRALAAACPIVRNVCNRSQSHRAGWRHGERPGRGHSAAARERGDVILLFYVRPESDRNADKSRDTKIYPVELHLAEEQMIHSRGLQRRGKIFVLFRG